MLRISRSSESPQEVVNDLLDALTDVESLNESVKDFVEDHLDLDSDTDPNKLSTSQQQYYWELYAMRTKEILIATINQL